MKLNSRLMTLFLLIAAAVFMGTWALASPPGSAADDNFHLPTIWCESTNVNCTHSENSYLVPAGTMNGTCYIIWIDRDVTRYNTNALCTKTDQNKMTPAGYLNQKSKIYPTFFYNISSLFVSSDLEKSILEIRFFWCCLFLVLFSLIFKLGTLKIRKSMVLTLAIFAAPLSVFTVASTNPSSAELAALYLLPFALMINMLNLNQNRLVATQCILAFLILLAIGSKADGFVYAISIFIFSIILFGNKSKQYWKRLILPFMTIINSIIYFNVFEILRNVNSIVTKSAIPFMPLKVDLLTYNILHAYEYLAGFWGFYWGLGWKFEPPINSQLAIVQLVIWLAILFVAWKNNSSIKCKILQILLLTEVIAIPLINLQLGYFRVGNIVQPRYILPFAASATGLLIGFSNIYEKDKLNRGGLSKGKRLLICSPIVMLALVDVRVFWIELVRNINGIDSGTISYRLGSWWWGQNFLSPWIIFSFHILTMIILSISYYIFMMKSPHSNEVESKRL